MQDQEMSLVNHLEELRKRIIVVLGAFVVFFIVGFVFIRDIYDWFVRDLDFKLAILGPSDIIWIYFKLAGMAALAGTIPVLVWQIWVFIKPALTRREQKVTLAYIPASFALFVGGLAFGYFVIFPTVFQFLIEMNDGMFETMFTIEKYFDFLIHLTLPFSFLFELPVIVMFLTSLGILTPQKLQKVRKYAYFVLVIIATMISPPDFVSQTLVAVPLVIIYEISILLSKVVYRKKARKAEEALAD
ncbi:twin-arginine translocase subunit TatC [Bacillus marinisedimentorum]|uniref:twin-arginine translocase subunit TatC n=1 Tax=Bacillus marinisedimentorum TaxID=1821260 RepID=UPI0007E097F0|nr:twin-arginine translocase subunit TatC [Bacillus marinisedimentorum]